MCASVTTKNNRELDFHSKNNSNSFNVITDNQFNDRQIDYLLPPKTVIRSEAIIADKELKAYADSSIKTYINNGIYNFTIQPLADALIDLNSLRLNIVAKCKNKVQDVTDKVLLGDFTLMNHISNITLKIGGADVQTISNPCIIKNMSKLFYYGSVDTQNGQYSIKGLYPRSGSNIFLNDSTDLSKINNISYKKGTSSTNAEFVVGEIISLSDIFQTDFYDYPFIYNRKIEVIVTWNSEKVVDINTGVNNDVVTIDEFKQYYLAYQVSILNQESKNQFIKAYSNPVKALIPNTSYIMNSLNSYGSNNQIQETVSIPIGFSSESVTIFFPNSTSCVESYCHSLTTETANNTNHTCNSMRFMDLQKVVISCGVNVLKVFDFRESTTDYDDSSTLLQLLTKNDTDTNPIGNFNTAYEYYLKDCYGNKVSYDEFLSDYFCLYIDTRPFSQLSSNNTLQIDLTFGNVVSSVNSADVNKGYTNQRILDNTSILRQVCIVTKNTKVLSFEPTGVCNVFNVANNIMNDYIDV